MKKLYLLIFALGFVSLNAQDVNFTFQVNMNETADFDAGSDLVWVVMDGDVDWNFTEYYEMADADADGIYSYTLTVASGGNEVVQQYSYAYGPDAANYKHWETPPSACANASDYREITVPANQGDITLPAVYYGTCSDVLGGIMVTFQVDMSDVSDLYEGGAVWLNMDNWTSWEDMTDEDGDDIYKVTLPYLELDEVKYLFSYQTGADPDNDYTDETVPAECATDGQRVFIVGADNQVLPAVKLGMCTDLVNITFQVDMSDIGDLTGAVWFNVNGDWTDWYDMADEGGNIYTVTNAYAPGDVVFYTYGYQNGPDPDNDFVDEVVPEACGGTFGVRRYLVGAADALVPVHKFNACTADTPELVEITFSVDMSNETVGGQVHQVIKSPWYWNELSLSGDDIYVGKVKVHKGQQFPYTFINGGVDEWSGEESVPEECNFGTPTAPERLFEGAMNDSVMPVIVFGSCIDMSEKYMLTFQVDMSGVTDLYNEGAVWVNINGDWTDWFDMTDENSDMVFEYTAEYSESEEVSYIFSYQNGADPNNDYVDETVPETCATDGVRVFSMGAVDASTTLVSFGSCTLDTRIGSHQLGALKLCPNPASDQLTIQLQSLESGIITVLDISGRKVLTQRFINASAINLSVESLVPELYVVTVVTEHVTFREKLLVE